MRWVARVLRLLLAAGMSLYLWHDGPFRPEYLFALAAAVLLGEFLFPLFFHRPAELGPRCCVGGRCSDHDVGGVLHSSGEPGLL